MTLRDFSLLTDENIDDKVVAYLRSVGFDVLHVREGNLIGSSDIYLIRLAYAQRRVIITHDRDFGSLAIANLEPVVGIVYLRPGHIDSTFTVETLQVLLDNNIEISSPFIIVADRKVNSVNIRIRPL